MTVSYIVTPFCQAPYQQKYKEVSVKKVSKKDFFCGWLQVPFYIPKAFELVYVTDDIFKSPLTAWWNGHGWSGKGIKKEKSYSYWKFIKRRYL